MAESAVGGDSRLRHLFLLNGGSFGQALIAGAANDAVAVGANAIGSIFNGSSWGLSTNNPAYVLAHGLLGCAAGAASGSGCGGGAIGGAASAIVNPLIDSNGNIPPAALAAISMLTAGGIAGALGESPLGAATSARK